MRMIIAQGIQYDRTFLRARQMHRKARRSPLFAVNAGKQGPQGLVAC